MRLNPDTRDGFYAGVVSTVLCLLAVLLGFLAMREFADGYQPDAWLMLGLGALLFSGSWKIYRNATDGRPYKGLTPP